MSLSLVSTGEGGLELLGNSTILSFKPSMIRLNREEVVSVGDSEGVVNVVLELFEVSRLEGDNSSDSDI